jgi:simple sugar transport system ATP-binding protein
VEGSGQRGLVAVLSGERRPDSGGVVLRDTEATRLGTARLRAMGLAHLPGDRYAAGGAAALSLTDNAIAGSQRDGGLGWGPFLSRARAERMTAGMIAAYDVRARSPRQPLGSLSGGNAQKLIAAREFRGRPVLLIADQPTRGIDIQAAAFLRARLLDLAAGGTAVLLVTADLEELLALSDRVLVLFSGRVAARFENGPELTPERLGPAMLGMAA